MSIEQEPRGLSAASVIHARRRQLLAAGGAALLAGLSPGLTAAQPAPRKGGILRLAAPFNPSSLDPVTGGAGSDHMVLYPVFDTLVDFEPGTLAPRPGLATAWNYPDPRTLVLTLRPGVRFHGARRWTPRR